VKRTQILTALACALLALASVGCGGSNHLQSITLSAAMVNGVAPSSQSGFTTLQGNGGTIQLQATGTWNNTKTKDISNQVTYNVEVDPVNNVDAFGNTLLPPCAVGTCPSPTSPPYTGGTVSYGPTGLITAVQPATCTWVNIAPVVTVGTAPTPAWFYSGDYVVTATFEGITSQPFYIPVASSAGAQYYPISEAGNPNYLNNPDGACGPSTTSN
jgi:hypothetical protein